MLFKVNRAYIETMDGAILQRHAMRCKAAHDSECVPGIAPVALAVRTGGADQSLQE